jgi:hypothetical protein
MFEKTNLVPASRAASAGALSPDERARLRAAAIPQGAERPESPRQRRLGDALRAVEWSELTARLNAARDLRLLLRTELQAPIESVAASFGDAAASYFALLDDDEPGVNRDDLGQSKVSGAMTVAHEATRSGDAKGSNPDAPRGDAREMQ